MESQMFLFVPHSWIATSEPPVQGSWSWGAHFLLAGVQFNFWPVTAQQPMATGCQDQANDSGLNHPGLRVMGSCQTKPTGNTD